MMFRSFAIVALWLAAAGAASCGTQSKRKQIDVVHNPVAEQVAKRCIQTMKSAMEGDPSDLIVRLFDGCKGISSLPECAGALHAVQVALPSEKPDLWFAAETVCQRSYCSLLAAPLPEGCMTHPNLASPQVRRDLLRSILQYELGDVRASEVQLALDEFRAQSEVSVKLSAPAPVALAIAPRIRVDADGLFLNDTNLLSLEQLRARAAGKGTAGKAKRIEELYDALMRLRNTVDAGALYSATEVVISAAKEIEYMIVVATLDTAREAGFSNVSLSAPNP